MARWSGVAETFVEQVRDLACGWCRVRWAVEGRECCKSFTTVALAGAFLGEPLDRLAVTVLSRADDPTKPDRSANPVVAKVSRLRGNAAMIPMRFGTSLDYTQGIRAWTDKLATDGLL